MNDSHMLKSPRHTMGARKIYNAMKSQIASGVFGENGQLPSSRALAQELGVSRTTVTIAYEQLTAEGFIEVRQGSRPRVVRAMFDHSPKSKGAHTLQPVLLSDYGKRVLTLPPRPHQPGANLVADFHYGDLSIVDFPTTIWKRAMNKAMAQRPERLTYSDPCGSWRLRTALQGYLWRARGLQCSPAQIIIVNGSQQGLDLCARLLLNPGDRFVMENPGYAMARYAFASTGALPVTLPADSHGLATEHLENVSARLAYVTPSHQYPLGGILPVPRRQQLLAWSRRQNAYVIEDDYDSEYRYDINPVPPLYGLPDSHNVIYLGTISKTLSPTLRIGYLVLPPELQPVFASAKQFMDRHSPITDQEAFASLIEDGTYEKHVRRVRRLNIERRETLLNALKHRFGETIIIEGADAGLHLVVWFKELPRSSEEALLLSARKARLGLYSISALYDPHEPDAVPDLMGLVMGYAALEPRQIERGVHRLAEVIYEVRHQGQDGKPLPL
ncbi:PLP-dependent aminotransferase family protein [Brucella gallinifaecis]|uniref:PLP-dependent aminotransferase family protein n=1 Tax=Brucella gallinifaecis TaxID=215590 RepID=A0A502BMM3_9HYPH|nr:PLP-dependent aminotransferase family protein [Brucella gallinifaecis]TPF75384.1 PLP-dependent aminotransferase family protein [Brucella gallinifaecis]